MNDTYIIARVIGFPCWYTGRTISIQHELAHMIIIVRPCTASIEYTTTMHGAREQGKTSHKNFAIGRSCCSLTTIFVSYMHSRRSTQPDLLVGNVLVETSSGGYLTAQDDGTMTTALPRPADNDPDNMPEPQDIITMVKVSHTLTSGKRASVSRACQSASSQPRHIRSHAANVFGKRMLNMSMVVFE